MISRWCCWIPFVNCSCCCRLTSSSICAADGRATEPSSTAIAKRTCIEKRGTIFNPLPAVDEVLDVSADLAVEVGKGADDLADADDEEGGKAWRYHEVVERRHQMALNVQAQLRSIQEWKAKVVASAEHEDVGCGHRAILERKVKEVAKKTPG